LTPFEIVEHTADVAVRVCSDGRNRLLISLTEALRFLYAGERPLPVHDTLELEVRAETFEEIMVRWANEIIYLFDTRGRLVVDADEPVFRAGEDGIMTARGRVSICETTGIGFSPELDLKAATYHDLNVTQSPDGRWRATVVFDT